MKAASHAGAEPPGAGNRMTAMPSQMKDMPSVTMIEGNCRA